MIKIINDDILNSKEDIICHQVNCQGVMGSGVAYAISKRWPIVKNKYLLLCDEFSLADTDLLGKYQLVEIAQNRYVANIFGQYGYGRRERVYTDYDALAEAFEGLRDNHSEKSFAFPYKFACGLANGDWSKVLGMIETYFNHANVRLYKI